MQINNLALDIVSAKLDANNIQNVQYFPAFNEEPNQLFSYEESTKVIRSYQFRTHLLTIDDKGFVIVAPENAGLVNQTWSLVAL